MAKIKKGQKYIVVCTQSIARNVAGLGNNGTFPKDCFVTHKGTPTDDPNDPRRPAQVYTRGAEDFPFDHHVFATARPEPWTHVRLDSFFRPVPVEVKINLL